MAPRSIWNGTITFGLVARPGQALLGDRVEERSTSTRSTSRDGARIEHRRICPKEDKEVPNDEIVKGYEVSEGKYVVLEQGRDQGGGRRPRQGHRRRALRRRAPRSTRSSTRRPTTSGPRDDAEDAYRLLHRGAASGPAGPGSAASSSTTASTWSPSARSTTCSRCTRCASTTRSSTAATSTSPAPRPQAEPARDRDGGKLVESLDDELRPRASYEDTYREAVLERDQAQGRGQGDRPGARTRSPSTATTSWPRSRRASDGEDAEWRARSGPARSASASSTCRCSWSAPRATSTCTSTSCTRRTSGADRAAPGLREGGQGGRLRGGRPRLRATTASRSSSPTRSSASAEPRKTRTIEIESFVDLDDDRPDLLRPPLLPGPGRRQRRARCGPTSCSSR